MRPSPYRAALAACFLAGLALSLGMLAQSQVGGDQLNLLARGWLLVAEGRLVPHGNPMSTGGNEPGPLTSLLVGLPLFVWRHHRAPTVVVLLSHVAAYWLLDRTLRGVLSPRGRLLLAVLYWLNPWRLYFSAFLWNPNWLFLFGAVHLWSCFRQRRRASLLASFVLVLAVGLALQIHASVVLLVIASALLWWRGYFRLNWGGVALGAAATAASLLPWLLALDDEPAIVAASEGFLGRGLVTVHPLLRGVLYWLRYGSLSVSEQFLDLDFGRLVGERANAVLAPALAALAVAVGAASLAAPLAANLRLFRRGGCRRRGSFGRARRLLRRLPAGASDRRWLRGYVALSFVAAVVVFCLTPTTIMMWQVVMFLHAAVLAVVLWGEALWRVRRVRRRAEAGLRLWAGAAVALGVVMMLGSPYYRCGGRDGLTFPLRADYPLLDDLGIHATCRWPVDPIDGWEPDVLAVP